MRPALAIVRGYDIDKGIPIPERYSRNQWPFARMNVGDSFFVDDVKRIESAKTAARTYAKKHGVKFTTRRKPNGVRIWRVA